MVVDRSAIKRWFAERTTTCDGSDVTETWRVIHNGADVLADAVALGTFQVLVLGHDAESFLTDQALGHVRNWVASDSGALVCYRGQPPEKSGTHTVFVQLKSIYFFS